LQKYYVFLTELRIKT